MLIFFDKISWRPKIWLKYIQPLISPIKGEVANCLEEFCRFRALINDEHTYIPRGSKENRLLIYGFLAVNFLTFRAHVPPRSDLKKREKKIIVGLMDEIEFSCAAGKYSNPIARYNLWIFWENKSHKGKMEKQKYDDASKQLKFFLTL